MLTVSLNYVTIHINLIYFNYIITKNFAITNRSYIYSISEAGTQLQSHFRASLGLIPYQLPCEI